MSTWSFSRKGTVFVLIVILLVGAFLRLHDLGKENLWTDESFSLHHAQEDDLTSLSEQVARTEAAPLGYYVLLHYWVKTFGSSELSVRMPSAIFGVLSIVMLFMLVRLFFDRKVALLSSFFLSTSMLQVLYSQEARLYGMFTFLTLLSSYFFFKWYFCKQSGKEKNLYSAAYLLSILAVAYTNYLAVILVALYSFVIIFNWKDSKTFFKIWILMHVAVLLLSLPLLPNVISQFNLINNGLSETLVSRGIPPIIASAGIFFFAIPFIIILLGLSGIYLFREKLKEFFTKIRMSDGYFTMLTLFFCASYIYLTRNSLSIFGLSIIPNPITNSYFLIRHPFFLVSFVYVFVAYKIANMRKKKLAVLCMILIIFVNSFSLLTYYEETTKAEWEEALSYIVDKDSHPLVLVDKGGFSNIFLLEYYLNEPVETVRLTWSNRSESRNLKMIDFDDLGEILEKKDNFWLVLARGNNNYHKEYLDTNYSLIEKKEFYEIELYHYNVKTNNFI